MKDKTIFTRAIDKAVVNGFNLQLAIEYEAHHIYWLHDNRYYAIIFSLDFAKAFFPKTDEHGFHKDDAWKYYLQQMVLEENPLYYLKKFLS
jgi:hypothetical protein